MALVSQKISKPLAKAQTPTQPLTGNEKNEM
jgi:hypothetical protein